MMAAESATRERVRNGVAEEERWGGGWGSSEGEDGGRGDGDLPPRGGRASLLSDGCAGERLRLRGGSGGFPVTAPESENGETGLCGVGTARVGLLPLPWPLPLPLSAPPPARWIMRSMVAEALLLSFTAPPLTAWMRVRCFRVSGDCRRRSARDGGCGWSRG